MTSAGVHGRDTDGIKGWTPIEQTNKSLHMVQPDIVKSAFGDNTIVELTPILQYAFEYNMVDNTEMWELTETNGGTVTTDVNALALLQTGTSASAVAIMKSKRHARYRAGLGSMLRFTARFTTPVAGTKQMIGMMDELGSSVTYKNGYAVGFDGTDFKFFHFIGDTLRSHTLEQWEDPMDGTGRSGFTIDYTKLNVFQIQLAYLGAGNVTVSVYIAELQQFVTMFRMKRSNKFTIPHVQNPNFHLITHVENTTDEDITLATSSMMYANEGKTKFFELHQPQQSAGAETTSISTQNQILSIRNKLTYTGKSNFIDILLEAITFSVDGTKNAIIKLLLNPTLGGAASWSDINTTDSVVEVDTSQTTISDEGKVLFRINTAKVEGGHLNLQDHEFIFSSGDELAITVESTSNTDPSIGLLWKELF